MMSWIRGLFHLHHWRILREVIVNDEIGRRVATIYVLQCEHCGDLKKRKIS